MGTTFLGIAFPTQIPGNSIIITSMKFPGFSTQILGGIFICADPLAIFILRLEPVPGSYLSSHKPLLAHVYPKR